MRVKHAQTREYMEVNALRGIVKDGAGTTLYNYFTEFGLSQLETDFVLGTAGTQVQAKVRDMLRKVETELKGETMTGVLALVSPEYFDKLIGHARVEEAYKYYSSTGAQPLREDTRRRFPFAGILFEEYNATVTLSTGATETLIPSGEGIAFLRWHGDDAARRAVYNNRIRLLSGVARAAFKLRAELCERSFALVLDRGGMRRAWLRGRENVHKRYLLHVAGYNPGLPMRQLIGVGTPREATASLALLASAGRHGNAGFIAVMLVADGTTVIAILVLDLRSSPD